MQTVSTAYKNSMKSPLRERVYIMISFGIINQEIQEKATVNEGDFTYYSNTQNVIGNHEDDTVYATLEENFTKVDGSMFFLPRQSAGVLPGGGRLLYYRSWRDRPVNTEFLPSDHVF